MNLEPQTTLNPYGLSLPTRIVNGRGNLAPTIEIDSALNEIVGRTSSRRHWDQLTG